MDKRFEYLERGKTREYYERALKWSPNVQNLTRHKAFNRIQWKPLDTWKLDIQHRTRLETNLDLVKLEENRDTQKFRHLWRSWKQSVAFLETNAAELWAERCDRTFKASDCMGERYTELSRVKLTERKLTASFLIADHWFHISCKFCFDRVLLLWLGCEVSKFELNLYETPNPPRIKWKLQVYFWEYAGEWVYGFVGSWGVYSVSVSWDFVFAVVYDV